MMSSKTDERGVKIADRGNQALSVEAVALLKTQDAGYLRTMAQKTKKAIERLEQALTFKKSREGELVLRLAIVEESLNPGHIAFVDTTEEQEAWVDERKVLSTALADRLQQNPLADKINLDSNEVEIQQTPQPKRKSLKQAEEDAKTAKANQRRRRRNQEIRQTTLSILQKREKDLRAAEVALEAQRSRMTGGQGIGVTKTGVTFKNTARKR